MSNKQIASSTLWQLASQIVMAVLSVLAAKFVAIALTKELTGYYNSAYGYLQIFAIIADFGLYAVSVRELAQSQEKERTLGALFVLRGALVFLCMGSAIAFVWLMPMWRGTPFPIGVTIASLVPGFTLLAGMVRTVFQVNYEMKFVFIAEVLQRILTTGGIAMFIFLGVRQSPDVHIYEWFLWIGGLGAFLLFIVSLIYAGRFMKLRFTWEYPLIKSLFLSAAPFSAAYLLMAVYRQLDVLFLALLRPDFAIQNAYYGFAGRVEDMAFLVPTFLLNSLLPMLSERLSNNQPADRLLGKSLLILLLSGSVFFLFSVFWARPLALLFATSAYVSTPLHPGSDTAFQLMALPMFLNGLVLYAFYVFLAKRAWKRLTLSFGFGAVLSIILNLLWTRDLGFVGAGSALVTVYCALTILLLPQALRAVPAHFPFPLLVRWAVFTIVLGGTLFVSAPFINTELRILAGFGCAGVLMVVLIKACGLDRILRKD
jgi:O-antigen/teichoic acid export membrane protein